MTIRTTSGIPREALPATLEMILRSNGATMIKEGDDLEGRAGGDRVRGNITPQLGNSSRALPPGYSVQIVPLKYVGVRQMMTILEPFQKDATTIRADDLRNLLIVSGTELELRHMLETIDMFDVNWLAGMSVGPVHAAERRSQDGGRRARQGDGYRRTRARWRASCASFRSSA